MTDSPWQDAAYTATFKWGKDYDQPWLVIKASCAEHLREEVIKAFGLEDGLTLIGAIHNANQTIQALGNLGRELGGRVVSRTSSSDQAMGETAGDDPWIAAAAAASEPKERVDPNKALLDEIEAATTTDQLKRFWVANNPLNDVVKAAWSKKGRSLNGQ